MGYQGHGRYCTLQSIGCVHQLGICPGICLKQMLHAILPNYCPGICSQAYAWAFFGTHGFAFLVQSMRTNMPRHIGLSKFLSWTWYIHRHMPRHMPVENKGKVYMLICTFLYILASMAECTKRLVCMAKQAYLRHIYRHKSGINQA